MSQPYESSESPDRLNPRRIFAIAGALAVHVGLFAFLMYPVTHDATAAAPPPRVQVTFVEPPPPPPPPPPAIPDPPKIVKVIKQAPPPPPQPPVETPPPNVIVEVVPPGPPGPPTDGPVIDPGPVDHGPVAAKSGELAIVRGHLAYSAQIRNLAGRVELRILVGPDGKPQDIQIEKSSGEPKLDREAKRQAMNFLFAPAIRNGQPVLAWAIIPIVFELDRG